MTPIGEAKSTLPVTLGALIDKWDDLADELEVSELKTERFKGIVYSRCADELHRVLHTFRDACVDLSPQPVAPDEVREFLNSVRLEFTPDIMEAIKIGYHQCLRDLGLEDTE